MNQSPKLLIYNRDAAMRQAYADYLTRFGLCSHSCGTFPELLRLLLWNPYETLLVDIDTALQSSVSFVEIIQRYLPEVTVIGTSSRPPEEAVLLAEKLKLSWFLPEPLTPKRVLEMMSLIGDNRCHQAKKDERVQLRRRLARATA
ncbi:MAG: hypothetical protein ACE5H9_05590 [Anaerolineae bacterium]